MSTRAYIDDKSSPDPCAQEQAKTNKNNVKQSVQGNTRKAKQAKTTCKQQIAIAQGNMFGQYSDEKVLVKKSTVAGEVRRLPTSRSRANCGEGPARRARTLLRETALSQSGSCEQISRNLRRRSCEEIRRLRLGAAMVRGFHQIRLKPTLRRGWPGWGDGGWSCALGPKWLRR